VEVFSSSIYVVSICQQLVVAIGQYLSVAYDSNILFSTLVFFVLVLLSGDHL
jgi:hypothetical protein